MTQTIYPAGVQTVATLTGAEFADIDNGGAVKARTTTGAIAALAGKGGTSAAIVNTPISTAGNGTLTAAGLVGGLISRTGPTGAFTDTTATASAIVAALPSFVSGATFAVQLKNATAWPQTITGGTGVTVSSVNVIGPFEVGTYYGVVGGTSASPTINLNHISTNAIGLPPSVLTPVETTLATNGAGTITAAGIVGGITNRTTVAAAFTDTTDTAANIVAASPGLIGKVGGSFYWRYVNASTAPATIAGGTGVTVSGVATVPPGQTGVFLVTETAATPTLTMVGLGVIPAAPTPNAAGATIAVTAAMAGSPILLNTAAGSVATLPAATGSGNRYLFVVSTSTTSAKHAILAASSSDSLTGIAVGENANTAKVFASAIATGNHSLQMPFTGSQPSGGIQGDWFELTDIAANQWHVRSAYQAGTTPTTPFSTATS